MKYTLPETIQFAKSFTHLEPAVPKCQEPALTIANEVMREILLAPRSCYRFPLKEIEEKI